jgi:hypothetical protein
MRTVDVLIAVFKKAVKQVDEICTHAGEERVRDSDEDDGGGQGREAQATHCLVEFEEAKSILHIALEFGSRESRHIDYRPEMVCLCNFRCFRFT